MFKCLPINLEQSLPIPKRLGEIEIECNADGEMICTISYISEDTGTMLSYEIRGFSWRI